MASEGGAAKEAGQESVVLASFANRHAAEHMLLSLSRGFRKKARMGGATALVVSGNKDGSLKLTESRVLEAGDLTATLLRISVSWMVGFWGTLSTLKGVKAGSTPRTSGNRTSDLMSSGPTRSSPKPARRRPLRSSAARTQKWRRPSRPELPTVATKAGMARSRSSSPAWTPGSKHDWVRAALDQPSNATG